MAKQARHFEEEPREGHAFEVDCSSGLANTAAPVAARPHSMARVVDAPVSGDILRDARLPLSTAWVGSMTYVSASYQDTRQDSSSIWFLDSSGSTNWGRGVAGQHLPHFFCSQKMSAPTGAGHQARNLVEAP